MKIRVGGIGAGVGHEGVVKGRTSHIFIDYYQQQPHSKILSELGNHITCEWKITERSDKKFQITL